VISATYGRKGLGDLQRTAVHSCNTMHYVSLLLQLVPPSNLTSGDDLFGLSIPNLVSSSCRLLRRLQPAPMTPPTTPTSTTRPKVVRPEGLIFFISCYVPPSTRSGAWPCQSKGRQTCGVLPSPLLYHQFSPSTCSVAWLKANLWVVRPEDIVPHEYLPFVDASLLVR
jgi:hypothetical protein